MASVCRFSSVSHSRISSLGLHTKSWKKDLLSPVCNGLKPQGSRSGSARRDLLSFCGGSKADLARQGRRRPGVVLCSSSSEDEDTDSEIVADLLDAKKERALYTTKLLIEAPLMGLCALAVWAYWAESARASGVPADIHAVVRDMLESEVPSYYYAVTLGVTAGYQLCSFFYDDFGALMLAAFKYDALRNELPSGQTEPPLKWDSHDEGRLGVQYLVLRADVKTTIFLEAVFLLPWAACTFSFPPTSEYDIWVRQLYLVCGPFCAISLLASQVCKCLALEAIKRATKKRGK